ncbi:MAG: response regulator [Candidatus Lokiarchaeota archaeon]
MKNLILLVEDDSAVLTSIQLLLESKGYNVETAFNGKEAIKKIENFENIPNLIISDISMPKMDGYQLLREVSKKPLLSHIPFIFLSGLSSEEDINLAKLLGADDYIKKPFKKEDLLASIKGKLKRYEISNNLNNKLKQLLITKEISVKPSISDEEKKAVYFFLMSWNKYSEPVLHDCYPKKQLNNIDLEGLSFQFFQAFGSISSTSMLTAPQDILVYVENIKI